MLYPATILLSLVQKIYRRWSVRKAGRARKRSWLSTVRRLTARTVSLLAGRMRSARTEPTSDCFKSTSCIGERPVRLRRPTPGISYLYPRSTSRWRSQSGVIRDGRRGVVGHE